MALSAVAASTPHYVLIDGNFRIGPNVVPSDASIKCSAIYGFSGKIFYDRFCANSQRALKPYPLVRGYLRNRIDPLGDSLTLVVIDAAGPTEPCLRAATSETVLEAQESRAPHVTAAYRLTFEEEGHAYRVNEQCHVPKGHCDDTHG